MKKRDIFIINLAKAIEEHHFGKYHNLVCVSYIGDKKNKIGRPNKDYEMCFYVAKHWNRRDTEKVIRILKENGVKVSSIRGGKYKDKENPNPYLYFTFDAKKGIDI